MRLLLPAAPAGDNDRQPGPDRLDHEGYEFLPGECGQIFATDLRCSQTTRGGENQPKNKIVGANLEFRVEFCWFQIGKFQLSV